MLRISGVRKFFSQSPFRRGDRNGMQENNDSSVRSTTDVNAEYEKTFRTKSYLEMYKRFKTKTPSFKSPSLSLLSSPPLSPSPSISFHQTISTQNPFKSHHETPIDSILQDPNLNQVLIDYFQTSYKAREKCESLLKDVFQIKANHHVITNIIKSFKHASILPELFKPFTAVTPQEFRELHETHRNLYRDLTSQRRKTKRRTKLRKYIKRAVVSFLVVGGSTLAAVLIVLFAHSMIGVVAAPGLLVLCSLVIFLIKKQKKKSSTAKGLIEQLDVAARGVFMMINDFESLGQQVARLNIDVESQERGFAGNHNDDEFMMNELVKKFQSQEVRFVEGLEELGKQAVLCLLDIKRSRNQVVEEISVA